MHDAALRATVRTRLWRRRSPLPCSPRLGALAAPRRRSRRATSSTGRCSSASTAARAIAWPRRRPTATSARTSTSNGSPTRESGSSRAASARCRFKGTLKQARSATSPPSSPARTPRASSRGGERGRGRVLQASAVSSWLRGGCSHATGTNCFGSWQTSTAASSTAPRRLADGVLPLPATFGTTPAAGARATSRHRTRRLRQKRAPRRRGAVPPRRASR